MQETLSLRRRMRTPVLLVAAMAIGFLLFGNLAMLGASAWAKETTPGTNLVAPAGVKNFTVVDAKVWRGAAPTSTGYRELADRGVRTIVDLRAEENVDVDTEKLARLGMRYVHIPIRDGQVPSDEEVDRFFEAVDESDGITFVHCGAGVGRTGAMAASYLVGTGQASSVEALRLNLAVGPPSLEQVAYVAGAAERPPSPLVAVSRILDAPRRLWSRFGF